MKNQLQSIIENLIECFDGKPWYGISVMEKLEQIPWQKVNEKRYGNKSIAGLVQHMYTWRIFVLKKLQGDANYTIEMNSTMDWTAIIIENELEWSALKEQLVATQREILAILNTAEERILVQQVPGKDYTFRTILTGVVQHDSYHLGQIAMLHSE